MEYLTLTNSTEIIRIASEDIVFIKGDGNYSDIYLSNGKAENVTYQLHGLMDKLEKFTYCPFHRVGKEPHRQQRLYLQSKSRTSKAHFGKQQPIR